VTEHHDVWCSVLVDPDQPRVSVLGGVAAADADGAHLDEYLPWAGLGFRDLLYPDIAWGVVDGGSHYRHSSSDPVVRVNCAALA
jgi:hypothetical protein